MPVSSGAVVNKVQKVERTFRGEANDRAEFAANRCGVQKWQRAV